MNAAIALLLAALAGLGGTAALAEQSKPGDRLFGVERAIEKAELALAAPQEKSALREKFAEERLQEISDIAGEPAFSASSSGRLPSGERQRILAGLNAAIENGPLSSSSTEREIRLMLDAFGREAGSSSGVRPAEIRDNGLDIRAGESRLRAKADGTEIRLKTETRGDDDRIPAAGSAPQAESGNGGYWSRGGSQYQGANHRRESDG